MTFLVFDTAPVCVSDHGFEHRISVIVTTSPRDPRFHVAAMVGVLVPGYALHPVDCWAEDWITAGADLVEQMRARVRRHLAQYPKAGRYVPSEGRG